MSLCRVLSLLLVVGSEVAESATPPVPIDPNKSYIVDDKEYSIEWSTMAPLPTNLSDTTASAVGTTIYIIGGCNSPKGNENVSGEYKCKSISSGTMAYDTQTNSWSSKAAMPSQRYRHAVAVMGTDIFVIGGRDVDDNMVTSVLKYSTTTNTWTTVFSDWMNATSDGAAFVQGGKLYSCGGWPVDYSFASANCYILDTTAQSPSFVLGPSFRTGRGDISILTMDGWAYAIGGFDSNFNALSSVERISLASMDTWTALTSGMQHGRGDFAAAPYKGRIVILGGEDGSDGSTISAGAALRYVEAYSPSSGVWLAPSQNVPIPYATFRFCGASVGDRIYIFGGQAPWDYACDCYRTKGRVFSYAEQVKTLLSGINARLRTTFGLVTAILLAMY